MKMIKLYLRTLLLVLFVIPYLPTNGFAQCNSNLLLNGAFEDELGGNTIAQGWEGTSSPDINNDSGELFTSSPTYEWIGMILPSPNGGTWQNIFGPERVFQTVELEVDKTYSWCVEYAAQGIQSLPNLIFDQAVGVHFIINDAIVHTSPYDTSQYSWELECITFTATQTTNIIGFQANEDQYLGIDGACLTEDIMSSIATIQKENDHYIYPNPVRRNGQINIHTNDNERFELALYNSYGSLVFQQENVSADGLVVPENLFTNTGIYYYMLTYENGQRVSGTFIVQ